jgi:hypothetical protein
MFIVKLIHLGNTFYLRSTVWTSDPARASEFASEEAAKAGLEKAKKFMKASTAREAKIEAKRS